MQERINESVFNVDPYPKEVDFDPLWNLGEVSVKKIPKIQKKRDILQWVLGRCRQSGWLPPFGTKIVAAAWVLNQKKKRASPIYIIYSQKIARVKGTVYILKLVWNEFISVVFSH